MSSITVRDLPNGVKETLRVNAAKSGMSLEAYARQILHSASQNPPVTQKTVLELADTYFGRDNGFDFELPPRTSSREKVDFE